MVLRNSFQWHLIFVFILDKSQDDDEAAGDVKKIRKPRIPHSRTDLLNKIELLRIAEDNEDEEEETDEENTDSEYDYDYSDDLESEEEK